MSRFMIREASLEDVPRILEIYSPYVTDTVISFEYEIPALPEFEERFLRVTRRYPWLVCERDGQLTGYAYADTYMIRPAYDWCADASVYVDRDARGQGAGRLLYEALFTRLRAMGVLSLYAAITSENEASIAFHRKMGFQPFAVFREVGYKQDRWLDVDWLELRLGERKSLPEPVRWIRGTEHAQNEENL